MKRRAIRTCWPLGTHTCSVSNDASHNHKDNNGGHHAASTPFPMPRVIRVSHCPIVGVSVCHREPPDIPSSKKERRSSTAFPATDAGCSTRLPEQGHKPIRNRLANYKMVLCPETTPNCGLKLVQSRVPARCRVQSHRSKFPRAIGRGVSKRRSPCECPIALTRMIRDKAPPNQIIDFVGGAEPALAQVERMFLSGGWPVLPRPADPCFPSLRGHGLSP